MKINKTIGALALGLGFAFVAQAQPSNTVGTAVYITGSTAFRAQIFNALGDLSLAKNTGDAGGNNTFTFQGNVNDATAGAALNLPANDPAVINAPVTVYCSFSGSAEGCAALIPPGTTATYENAYGSGPASTFSYTGADIAMSDVAQSSCPAPYSPASSGVTLAEAQLASDKAAHGGTPGTGVAVVPFTFVGNKAATAKLGNITYQNIQSLFTSGTLPLCFFTGNAADAGTSVYAVGRYNLSGTRITAVLDDGIKTSANLKQYALTADGGVTTPGLLSTDPLSPPNNAADQWVSVGNNGYFTGGNVGKAIDYSSQNNLPPAIAYIGWADATSKLVAANGDAPITFNGQNPGTLAAWNLSGLENGAFTFWSYERMYVAPGDVGGFVQNTFAPALILAIQYEITHTVPTITADLESNMNVYRNSDGGTVFHF